MIGAADAPHRIEPAALKMDDPSSPLNKAFGGKGLVYTDEYYRFHDTGPTAYYTRDKLRVLLSIDMAKTDMIHGKPFYERPDKDYAVSWIRNMEGPDVQLSLGHTPTLFMTPNSPGISWRRSSSSRRSRGVGAAPRQRGSSDGWTLSVSCSSSSSCLISAPNAQTSTFSGAAAEIVPRASSALASAGWKPLEVQLARRVGHRQRRELAPPRPAGRSGRVTTSAGRCGEGASSRSTSAANRLRAEVDPSSLGQRLAKDPQSLRWARGARSRIQHAVEVVDLVLQHAHLQARCLDGEVLAELVLRGHGTIIIGRSMSSATPCSGRQPSSKISCSFEVQV